MMSSTQYSGYAADKLDDYLDSITAKMTQFQNKVQEFWNGLLSSDFIKGFVDAGNAVMSFANKFGSLQSVMTAVFALLASKNIKLFRTEMTAAGRTITIAGKSFKDFGQSVKAIFSNGGIKGFLNSFGSKYTIGDDAFAALTKIRTDLGNATFTNEADALNQIRASAISCGVSIKGLSDDALLQLTNQTRTAVVSQEDLAKAFQKTNGFGIKLMNIGKSIATGFMNAGVSLAISAIFGLIINSITELINSYKKVEERATEAKNKFDELTSTATDHKKAIDDILDEYTELSKGVDNLGNNQSLTNDQYARYNELSAQIAKMFPSLITGFNDQGTAVANLKGNIVELTKAYEEEQQAARDALILGARDIEKTAYDKLAGGNYYGHFDSLLTREDFLNNLMELVNAYQRGEDDFYEAVKRIIPSNSKELYGFIPKDLYNMYGAYFDPYHSYDYGFRYNQFEDVDFTELVSKIRQLQAESNSAMADIQTLTDAFYKTKLYNQSTKYSSIIDNDELYDLGSYIVSNISQGIYLDLDNQDISSWVDDVLTKLKDVASNADTTEISEAIGTLFNNAMIDSDTGKLLSGKSLTAYRDAMHEAFQTIVDGFGYKEGSEEYNWFYDILGIDDVDALWSQYDEKSKEIADQVGTSSAKIKGVFIRNGITNAEAITDFYSRFVTALEDGSLKLAGAENPSKVIEEWWKGSITPQDTEPLNLSDILGNENQKKTVDAYVKDVNTIREALEKWDTLKPEEKLALYDEFASKSKEIATAGEVTSDALLRLADSELDMAVGFFNGVEGAEEYIAGLQALRDALYGTNVAFEEYLHNAGGNNSYFNTLKKYTEGFSEYQKALWIRANPGGVSPSNKTEIKSYEAYANSAKYTGLEALLSDETAQNVISNYETYLPLVTKSMAELTEDELKNLGTVFAGYLDENNLTLTDATLTTLANLLQGDLDLLFAGMGEGAQQIKEYIEQIAGEAGKTTSQLFVEAIGDSGLGDYFGSDALKKLFLGMKLTPDTKQGIDGVYAQITQYIKDKNYTSATEIAGDEYVSAVLSEMSDSISLIDKGITDLTSLNRDDKLSLIQAFPQLLQTGIKEETLQAIKDSYTTLLTAVFDGDEEFLDQYLTSLVKIEGTINQQYRKVFTEISKGNESDMQSSWPQYMKQMFIDMAESGMTAAETMEVVNDYIANHKFANYDEFINNDYVKSAADEYQNLFEILKDGITGTELNTLRELYGDADYYAILEGLENDLTTMADNAGELGVGWLTNFLDGIKKGSESISRTFANTVSDNIAGFFYSDTQKKALLNIAPDATSLDEYLSAVSDYYSGKEFANVNDLMADEYISAFMSEYSEIHDALVKGIKGKQLSDDEIISLETMFPHLLETGITPEALSQIDKSYSAFFSKAFSLVDGGTKRLQQYYDKLQKESLNVIERFNQILNRQFQGVTNSPLREAVKNYTNTQRQLFVDLYHVGDTYMDTLGRVNQYQQQFGSFEEMFDDEYFQSAVEEYQKFMGIIEDDLIDEGERKTLIEEFGLMDITSESLGFLQNQLTGFIEAFIQNGDASAKAWWKSYQETFEAQSELSHVSSVIRDTLRGVDFSEAFNKDDRYAATTFDTLNDMLSNADFSEAKDLYEKISSALVDGIDESERLNIMEMFNLDADEVTEKSVGQIKSFLHQMLEMFAEAGNEDAKAWLEQYDKSLVAGWARSDFIKEISGGNLGRAQQVRQFVNGLTEEEYQLLLTLDIDENTSLDVMRGALAQAKKTINAEGLLDLTFRVDNADTTLSNYINDYTSKATTLSDTVNALMFGKELGGKSWSDVKQDLSLYNTLLTIVPNLATEMSQYTDETEATQAAIRILTAASSELYSELERDTDGIFEINNATEDAKVAFDGLLAVLKGYVIGNADGLYEQITRYIKAKNYASVEEIADDQYVSAIMSKLSGSIALIDKGIKDITSLKRDDKLSLIQAFPQLLSTGVTDEALQAIKDSYVALLGAAFEGNEEFLEQYLASMVTIEGTINQQFRQVLSDVNGTDYSDRYASMPQYMKQMFVDMAEEGETAEQTLEKIWDYIDAHKFNNLDEFLNSEYVKAAQEEYQNLFEILRDGITLEEENNILEMYGTNDIEAIMNDIEGDLYGMASGAGELGILYITNFINGIKNGSESISKTFAKTVSANIAGMFYSDTQKQAMMNIARGVETMEEYLNSVRLSYAGKGYANVNDLMADEYVSAMMDEYESIYAALWKGINGYQLSDDEVISLENMFPSLLDTGITPQTLTDIKNSYSNFFDIVFSLVDDGSTRLRQYYVKLDKENLTVTQMFEKIAKTQFKGQGALLSKYSDVRKQLFVALYEDGDTYDTMFTKMKNYASQFSTVQEMLDDQYFQSAFEKYQSFLEILEDGIIDEGDRVSLVEQFGLTDFSADSLDDLKSELLSVIDLFISNGGESAQAWWDAWQDQYNSRNNFSRVSTAVRNMLTGVDFEEATKDFDNLSFENLNAMLAHADFQDVKDAYENVMSILADGVDEYERLDIMQAFGLTSEQASNRNIERIGGFLHEVMTKFAEAGDEDAKAWLEQYDKSFVEYMSRASYIKKMANGDIVKSHNIGAFVRDLTDEDFQLLLTLDIDQDASLEDIKGSLAQAKRTLDAEGLLNVGLRIDNQDTTLSDYMDDLSSKAASLKTAIDSMSIEEKYGGQSWTEIKKDLSLYEELLKIVPDLEIKMAGYTDETEATKAAVEILTAASSKLYNEFEQNTSGLFDVNNATEGAKNAFAGLEVVMKRLLNYDIKGDLREIATTLDKIYFDRAGDKARSFTDAIGDVESELDTLYEAYTKLMDLDLRQDSVEFTSLVNELIQKIPELIGHTGSIYELRNAIAQLMGEKSEGLIERLRELALMEGISDELRGKIEALITSFYDLGNQPFSMDNTVETLRNVRKEMDQLAQFVNDVNKTGLHLDIDTSDDVFEYYPELLKNAQLYADGTIQLDKDVYESFIHAREAELKGDIEAKIKELENANALAQAQIDIEQKKIDIAQAALESKSGMKMAEALSEIEAMEAVSEAEAVVENNSVANDAAVAEQKMKNSAEVAEQEQGNLLNTDQVSSDVYADMSQQDANTANSMQQNSAQASATWQQNLLNLLHPLKTVAEGVRKAMNGETDIGGGGVSVTFGKVLNGIKTGITGAFNVMKNAGNWVSNAIQTLTGVITGTKAIKLGGKTGSITQAVISRVGDLLNGISSTMRNNLSERLQGIVDQSKSRIAELQDQIAKNNYNIELLKANGGLSLDQMVGRKAKEAADKAASKGGSGSDHTPSSKDSSGSGDKDKEEKEFNELYDWIEVRIKRLETEISILDKTVSNTYRTFTRRNQALRKEIGNVTDEMEVVWQGYQRYLLAADSVELDESYKEKVRLGLIDIENITDEALSDSIKLFKEWFDKSEDMYTKLLDLAKNVSDLYKQIFSMIQEETDSIITTFKNEETMLNNAIDKTEERGYLVSTRYYDALISNAEKQERQLLQERADLINAFQEALDAGAVEDGSQEWYNYKNSIDSVTLSIDDLQKSILEYQSTIQQLNWDIFDLQQERISEITSEADFLIELMSNRNMYSDNGFITNYGLATKGLHGVNYNTYMEQADQYHDEMLAINKQLANDPNNQKLYKRRQELLEQQQEMISAAEQEKEALKSLVKEGVDATLSSLKNMIDEYNNAIDSQKSLYDFQKNVAKQTKDINDLQKQLLSLNNDDSEENRKRLQELQVSLNEAQENLDETLYERAISDQRDMLDQLYSEFDTVLNERLDNIDALMVEEIAQINANGSAIEDTLRLVSGDVGYAVSSGIDNLFSEKLIPILSPYTSEYQTMLTDERAKFIEELSNYPTGNLAGLSAKEEDIARYTKALNELLGANIANLSTAEFRSDFTTQITTVQDRLGSIYKAIREMTAKSAEEAEANRKAAEAELAKSNLTGQAGSDAANKAGVYDKADAVSAVRDAAVGVSTSSGLSNGSGTRTGSGTIAAGSNPNSGNGKPDVGDTVTYSGSYYWSSWGMNPVGELLSDQPGAVEIYQVSPFASSTHPYRIRSAKTKGDLGWVSLSQLRGYYTGTKSVDKDRIAQINEHGIESIIRPDGSILTPLAEKSMVINAKSTDNMWRMLQDPEKFMGAVMENVNATTNNMGGNIENHIEITIPISHVNDFDDFMTQVQNSDKFERMFDAMLNTRVMGSSKYNKYNVRFN